MEAQKWNPNKIYRVGELVSYNGNIFKNTTGNNTFPQQNSLDWIFLSETKATKDGNKKILSKGKYNYSDYIEEDDLVACVFDDDSVLIGKYKGDLNGGGKENKDNYEKIINEDLFLKKSQYLNTEGKILSSMIESLGLTELIVSNQTSLSGFISNYQSYTYEKNDFIAIPDASGNYSLYMFKGGGKTVSSNYLPTGLTNITISMVQGLQSALDNKEDKSNKRNNLSSDSTNTKYPTVTAVNEGLLSKLDKPSAIGDYYISKTVVGGVSYYNYKTINLTSGQIARSFGQYIGPSNLFEDSEGNIGLGTTSITPASIFDIKSTGKVSLPAPRMTQIQRQSIVLNSLCAGGLVYQTDGAVGYYLWDGVTWKTLGSNISNADLSNSAPRTFTQANSFTWDTVGNPYYLKGLTDIGNNYSGFPKVLRLDPTTKKVVEGDALVVTIPDTLPNPVTPSSQTLTIVHTYTNSPTALNTNVQALNDFIMNIGNLQFTALTFNNWMQMNLNGNTFLNSTTPTNNINLGTNINDGAGVIRACAYPDLVLPSNRNWCFVIGGSVGTYGYASGNGQGVISMCNSQATTNVGLINTILSCVSHSFGNISINEVPAIGANGSNEMSYSSSIMVVFTKVGNILNITVRGTNTVKTANIDVTGIAGFKPVIQLRSGNTSWSQDNKCNTDFGMYYIEPDIT